MLRLLTDENFKATITYSLLEKGATLDLVRVQQVRLSSLPDEAVLAWAALQHRIVLTHDIKTLVPLANTRIALEQPMPGVIVVPWSMDVGLAVRHLSVLLGAGSAEDFANLVFYV